MKRFVYVFALFFTLMLSSCALTEAQVLYSEYYDSNSLVTVVYINEVPCYKIWDEYRWIYRPVPRERWQFIRINPRHYHQRDWTDFDKRPFDVGHQRPMDRPNMRPMDRPNTRPMDRGNNNRNNNTNININRNNNGMGGRPNTNIPRNNRGGRR